MLSFGMPNGCQHLCGGVTKRRTAKKQNSKMRKPAVKRQSTSELAPGHASTRRARLFASMIRLAGEVLRSALIAKLLIFFFLPTASAISYESFEFLGAKLGDEGFRVRAFTHEGFILNFYQATFQTLPKGFADISSHGPLIAWCILDYFGIMPWSRKCKVCGKAYNGPYERKDTYKTKDGEEKTSIFYRYRGQEPKKLRKAEHAGDRCVCFGKYHIAQTHTALQTELSIAERDVLKAGDEDTSNRTPGIRPQSWLPYVHLVVLMAANYPWGMSVNAMFFLYAVTEKKPCGSGGRISRNICSRKCR